MHTMVLQKRSVVVLVFLLSAASLIFSQSTYRELEVKNGGTIRGTVRLSGKAPAPEVVEVSRDIATCGKSKQITSLVTGNGNGVQDSFVYLEGVTTGKKWPAGPMVSVNQIKCEYEPHVLVVRAGEKMEIANSDSLLHNVHAYGLNEKDPNQSGPPTLFNMALPIQGLKIPRTMSKPGMVMMLCDAGHPWMNAYILVAENPYYAVTDVNGSFVVDAVLPGSYKVRLWHEGIGKFEKTTKAFVPGKPFEQEKKITVQAGKTVTLNFDLSL